jgi:hypothetical protein
LETLGDDLGEGLEGVQDLSGRARERMRERLASVRKRAEGWEARRHEEEEDEEEESGVLGAVLALGSFLLVDMWWPRRRRSE